jgi:hypothetical protein
MGWVVWECRHAAPFVAEVTPVTLGVSFEAHQGVIGDSGDAKNSENTN